MDKIGQEALLFDFYGPLLTQKQIEIMDMHMNSDLSLGEISEHLGISRQGVHDAVKKSVLTLTEYEKKLGLVNKYLTQKDILIKIIEKTNMLKTKFPYSGEISALENINNKENINEFENINNLIDDINIELNNLL